MDLKNIGSIENFKFHELTKNLRSILDQILEVIKYFEFKEIIGEFTLVLKGNTREKKSKLDSISIKQELNELINAGLSLSAASNI